MAQAPGADQASGNPPGSGWYPVAVARTLPVGHIGQACLDGQDLALWQANDGHFNVWANRCLHRGVRLSLGTSDGHELRCRYHGWRYANRTGNCTYIPAHPASTPAATLCHRVFPSAVHGGLLWTSLQADAEPADLPDLSALGARVIALRPLPFNAPASVVREQLRHYPVTGPVADPAVDSTAESTNSGNHRFFVQPVGRMTCVVFGLVSAGEASDQSAEATVLCRHNNQLTRIRRRVEATGSGEPGVQDNNALGTGTMAALPAGSVAGVTEPPALKVAGVPVTGPATPPQTNQVPRRRAAPVARRSTPPDRSGAFTVHLARTQQMLQVKDGQSLLQALRAHGIRVASACEQGACGTCRLKVLDGIPRHLDMFLTEAERTRGDCIMACVSRAASDSLTLDL